MPVMRACLSQGCPELVPLGESHCERHRKAKEQSRETRTERGYDNVWLKESKRFREGKLCVLCLKKGKLKAAAVTDHIVPHRGDEALFWDTANWQPLCKACHDIKTATEDGGFGR